MRGKGGKGEEKSYVRRETEGREEGGKGMDVAVDQNLGLGEEEGEGGVLKRRKRSCPASSL